MTKPAVDPDIPPFSPSQRRILAEGGFDVSPTPSRRPSAGERTATKRASAALRLSELRADPKVAPVLAAVPEGVDPVAVWRFLSEPCPDLEDDDDEAPLTPIEWLRRGRDAAPVVAILDWL